MLLTDQQWVQLESIFAKVTLDSHGRKAFLIPIARSVQKDAASAPFAEWLAIPGADDFVVIMRHVIQKAQEPALEKSFVHGLKKIALNLEDQEILSSLLEFLIDPQRSPSPEPNDAVVSPRPISQEAHQIINQSIGLFEKSAYERKELVTNTIAKSLRNAEKLAWNLIHSGLLKLGTDAKAEDISKALLSSELPIKLLDEIVRSWNRQPSAYQFIRADAPEFHMIKEILVMESLPHEDRNQFRHALLEAKHSATSQGASSDVDVPVQKEDERMLDYLKKLIQQTWLLLTSDQKNLSEALRLLLNPRDTVLYERTRLLGKVRFIQEPNAGNDDQYRNGVNEKVVAQHLINALAGRERIVEEPSKVLKQELSRMSEEEELLVMIVTDKRELLSYLELLKQSFPSVQTIGLKPYEGKKYSDVTHHLDWIEKKIPPPYVMKLDDGPAHR
jgi:hypothetical protein